MTGKPRWLALLVAALVMASTVVVSARSTYASSAAAPSGLKHFDGVTIHIATLAAGPKGVISGVLYKYRDEWNKLTGGTVDVAEVPYGDIHTKMMADLQTGIGRYDGCLCQAWFYGDYMAGNFIKPIDGYIHNPQYPQFDNNAVLPPVKNLLRWGNHQYAPPFDADEFVLWYRTDLLSNPTFKRQFKARYGYNLLPPQTIDQLIDEATFFQGKRWPGSGGPGVGIAMSLKSGQSTAQFWYQAIAGPYSVLPGKRVDRYHNVFWFDPVTLQPLINDPGHQEGLRQFLRLARTGAPQSEQSWDLGQSWDAFWKGHAAFTINTADIPSGAQTSPVRGKVGGEAIPGSKKVWNRQTERWVTFARPNRVGNLEGANWNGVISKFSKNPDAVYSFFAFLAQKQMMMQDAYAGWDGVDPTSRFQFLPPYGNGSPAGYKAAGWSLHDARNYSRTLYQNLKGVNTYIHYLRTRGTSDMLNDLDAAVTNALAGRTKPGPALNGVASSWRRTVSSLGGSFKSEYRTSISFGKAPTGP